MAVQNNISSSAKGQGVATFELSSWSNTFDMLDADGSGYIDREELRAGLIALGQKASDDDIAAMLEAAGISMSDGVRIDIQAFLRIVNAGNEFNEELDESDVREMFQALDIDASGYLTAAEIIHILANLGMFLTDAQTSQMLSMYDGDCNGRISYEEFKLMMVDLGFKVKKLPDLDTDMIKKLTEEIDKTFDKYDINSDGKITLHELKLSLEGDLKVELNDEQVEYLMSTLDTCSKDGVLQRDEFVTLDQFQELLHGLAVKAKKQWKPDEEMPGKTISLDSIADKDLREALMPFDTQGLGVIDLDKVHQAAEGKTPPKLHWSKNRPTKGLARQVQSVNHIAILVSDVSKSLQFYKDIMGFEQIRRPNFDAHGAWVTMGNVELHLIKGEPLVHTGDDLVVSHISLDAKNINSVLGMLNLLKYPFRVNSSVPAGADAGTMNTNDNEDMMSSKIITQYFLRDPDGYYLEICNCDEVLTKYCMGEREDLPGYVEGVKPLSIKTASTSICLMDRWVAKMELKLNGMEENLTKVKSTDGSIGQVAALLGCTRADEVDHAVLQTLRDRHSVYGDVWQNEEKSDIEEILTQAKNDPKRAEEIVILRQNYRRKSVLRPPDVFNADGTKTTPAPVEVPMK